MAQEVKFEIRETIISINDGESKWNTELNLVSWNGREPKYDIRKWSPDHSKMGKGISLSEDEAVLLFQQAEKFLGRFRTEPVREEKAPVQEDFFIPDQSVSEPPTPTGDDLVLPFD